VLQSDHADVAAALVAAFGPHVSLISVAPAGLMLEFAAGTFGGKHAETTEIPVAGAALREPCSTMPAHHYDIDPAELRNGVSTGANSP